MFKIETSPKKVTNSRLFELDGLRGIAAIAVVIFHYFYLYNENYGHDFIISYWTKLGYLGVNLFFIISGFGAERMQVSFTDFLWNLSMIHQYFWIPSVDGVYWTLTLELTFYTWMLCFFIAGWIKKIEIPLLIWVVAAKVLVLSFGWFHVDLHPLWEKVFLLKYIELFAAGICIYRIYSRNFFYFLY